MMAGTSFNVSVRRIAPAIIRLVLWPVVGTPTRISLNRGASRGVDHTFDQVLWHRIGPQVTRRTAGFHRFDDIHDRLLFDSASLIFVATQQLLMSYASHGSQVDRPDAPNESPRCHLTGEGAFVAQFVNDFT